MFNGRLAGRSDGAHIVYDCDYCAPDSMENLHDLRSGSVDSQRLNHWRTVTWDPGIVDSLCLMALFRAVMSLARYWAVEFVWKVVCSVAEMFAVCEFWSWTVVAWTRIFVCFYSGIVDAGATVATGHSGYLPPWTVVVGLVVGSALGCLDQCAFIQRHPHVVGAPLQDTQARSPT